MNVTKCDSCGKIVGNNEAFKLDLTNLKTNNNKTVRVCRVEICGECKNKILDTLNLEEVE